jgi:transcriptional regulator with XRE-family HTH domain
MDKVELQKLVARNLQSAIERKFAGEWSQSSLARVSKVSQKTISNILSANEKSDEEVAELPSTSITILAILAETLDVPIWALLHPDPYRASRVDDMFKTIERDFQASPAHVGKKDEIGGVILGEIAVTHGKSKNSK